MVGTTVGWRAGALEMWGGRLSGRCAVAQVCKACIRGNDPDVPRMGLQRGGWAQWAGQDSWAMINVAGRRREGAGGCGRVGVFWKDAMGVAQLGGGGFIGDGGWVVVRWGW